MTRLLRRILSLVGGVVYRLFLVDAVRAEIRNGRREHGPPNRLWIDPTAVVNDAVFNTVSGTITIEEFAFFGHGVTLVTGTHDLNQFGLHRQQAAPAGGRDILIGAGAWIGSNATVLGPCRIGRDAVVAAGAVVTRDVPDLSVVGGVPARLIRTISSSKGEAAEA